MIVLRSYFHGEKKPGPYFEGWYFKCRTKAGKSMALIPAFHIDSENRHSASLQVITAGDSWWVAYPDQEFAAEEKQFCVQVGQNVFFETGLSVNTDRPGLSLSGRLDFGRFLPLRSDIMGPFRFLPNLECAHGVISMAHTLQGKLTLNGEIFDFDGGQGYIETDRGRAFPREYLWAQGFFPEGSFMLSVADIPLAGRYFTGCICALLHNGKEYRLATYRGARAERWSEGGAVIRQGKIRLEIEVQRTAGQALRAPAEGEMTRRVQESLCAHLRCRFWVGDALLLDRTDQNGSFEFSRPENT